MRLEEKLEQYFGYQSFRTGQKEVIEAVLEKRDVLAVMPTGAGKSICYQLPALLLPGLTIVVSPLLSLMEDQVQELKSYGMKRVTALNSLTPFRMRQAILKTLANYKMIYLSPEMLQATEVLQALASVTISLLVVDEAHCISQWGHEFRTDYLKLSGARTLLHSPPCLALTATATKAVQEDIIKQLKLKDVNQLIFSVDRKNIAMAVREVEHIDEKISLALEIVRNLEGPGLIYFSSRGWTERFSSLLREKGEQKVAHYHGGMDGESRLLIQQQFIHDQLQIVCCTNAFGMGINKKNIRYVIHFHYPTQMESYIQEIGRAGRDGQQSIAILLYAKEDSILANSLIDLELPTEQQIRETLSFFAGKYGENVAAINEQDFLAQFGLGEVGMKVINYYLETAGILNKNQIQNFNIEKWTDYLSTLIEKRRAAKREKLRNFQQWIQSKQCRRQAYLAYFDEKKLEKTPDCCDNCEPNILEKVQKRTTKLEETSDFDWKKELRLILHILDEEKEWKS